MFHKDNYVFKLHIKDIIVSVKTKIKRTFLKKLDLQSINNYITINHRKQLHSNQTYVFKINKQKKYNKKKYNKIYLERKIKMTKKFFTDESLATFVNETKTYADNAVAELSSIVVYASDSNENVIAETDGINASEVSYVNTASGLSSTNVQSAIDELSEETSQLSSEIVDLPNNEILIGKVAEVVKTEVPLVKTAEQPTFVNSVDEMTDTSKIYVMPDGFLYAYMQKTTVTVGKNHFVPTEAIINARLSGSSGSITENGSAGSVVTGFIAVNDWNSTNPFEVSIGSVSNKGSDDNRVVFYDANKTKLGYANIACSHDGITTPNGVWENGIETYNLKVDKTGNAVTITDVAYIRMQILVGTKGTAITDSDVANLQIKFVHETSTTTQTGFFSTGQAYNQPADYEEEVLKLKQDVNALNEAVTELQNSSGNDSDSDSDSDEVSVPTAWESAVDECIAKIKALQVGRNCVTFPFFSDTHTNFSHLGALIGKVMKDCKIPYCIFGGDSPDSDYITEQTMLAQEKSFVDSVTSDVSKDRFYRTLGNHDGWWNPSATQGDEVTYSREQMYELYFRNDKIIEDRQFGIDGTYYYVDEHASKVRFIFMNVAFGGDDTQIEWLRDKALSFNESGWAVVLFGHAPITNHYNAFISKAPQIRQVLVDYINGNSENKADVVGWFSGHIHRDRIFSGYPNNELSTEGSTDDNLLPFKTITIISDNTNISYDSESHPLDGSDESHAIDFVTINKKTRTVNITRLGIGNDRSYTY